MKLFVISDFKSLFWMNYDRTDAIRDMFKRALSSAQQPRRGAFEKQQLLYLDNNADTSECEASVNLRKAQPQLGNPSSLHHAEGRRASAMLNAARDVFKLECHAPEMIFTSGATESNHLALTAGMNMAAQSKRIAITPFEHPSVARVAAAYEPIHVPLLKEWGTVDCDKLYDICAEPDVGMVSIILAHNELGIVQPIKVTRLA